MGAVARVSSLPHIELSSSELLFGTCCPRFSSNFTASKFGLHSLRVLGGRRFPGCKVDLFKHTRQLTTNSEYMSSGLQVQSLLPNGTPQPRKRQPRTEYLTTLVEPVGDDLLILNNKLRAIIPPENPLLMAAANENFGAGDKRLRPALVFLVSKATSQLAGMEEMRPEHWDLALVIDMIHTAGLIHRNLLDKSGMGRGENTVHTMFGTRGAVLAGDFMFAHSTWHLANVDNLEVIKLINKVMKDFAGGEIKHGRSWFESRIKGERSLDDYLEEISHKNASKISYYLENTSYKNASLISASTRSAAILSEMYTTYSY